MLTRISEELWINFNQIAIAVISTHQGVGYVLVRYSHGGPDSEWRADTPEGRLLKKWIEEHSEDARSRQ